MCTHGVGYLFEESIQLKFVLIAEHQSSVLSHPLSCTLEPLLERRARHIFFITCRHACTCAWSIKVSKR